MVPLIAGVGSANNNALPGEAERPNLRRLAVTDSWLDRFNRSRCHLLLCPGLRAREFVVNYRIAIDASDIGTRGKRNRDFYSSLDPDHVDDVVGAMLDSVGREPIEDRTLRRLRLLVKRLVDEQTL